jgi:hypothetical protein
LILIFKNFFLFLNSIFYLIIMHNNPKLNGDWGLGIGDWGLGIGDWAQSPIPNPQTPNPQSPCFYMDLKKYLVL